MEKIFWIVSKKNTLLTEEDDGLSEVNAYLEQGWKVKHIVASHMGGSVINSNAYIVLEKEN